MQIMIHWFYDLRELIECEWGFFMLLGLLYKPDQRIGTQLQRVMNTIWNKISLKLEADEESRQLKKTKGSKDLVWELDRQDQLWRSERRLLMGCNRRVSLQDPGRWASSGIRTDGNTVKYSNTVHWYDCLTYSLLYNLIQISHLPFLLLIGRTLCQGSASTA